MKSLKATTLCAALVLPLLTSCQAPQGAAPAPHEIAKADADREMRKRGPTLTLDEQAKLADPTALQLLEQRSQELAKAKKRVEELEEELSQRGRDLEKLKDDSKSKSREKEQMEGLLRDATENERAANEKALSAEIARLKIEQEVLRMKLGNLVKEN
jgi:hypothetical protein